MDLGLLRSVHIFPVRHHSPRSSAALRTFLDSVEPVLVLIEGPSDATSLLSVLVDPGTKPPVAILGYRVDGTPGSLLWPFASYSPEYVAARWGFERGARVELIDISIGAALAPREADPVGHEDDDAPSDEEDNYGSGSEGGASDAGDEERAPSTGVYESCARARGFRSFEEFWEASFEAPAYDPASFRAALLAYAELARADDDRMIHRAREAFMARQILIRIGPNLPPGKIAVVVGAAHAAAFVAGDVDLSLEALLPEPVPASATLIPYSFPRLASQHGYGAGNRAPNYYQRAHDAGCDFHRATLEVLVEFTTHLRLRGFMASLADTIEAYRLAVGLAELRGKAGPGLDEVREATIATLCRGDVAHVDRFLWPSVIGRRLGIVADRIGKNTLQEEFWREVLYRKLPTTDMPERFTLKLIDEFTVGTSVFLHRLRLAGVPYAHYIGMYSSRARGIQDNTDDARHFLTQASEAWEAQWTPSTDAALIEKIVLGETLERMVTQTLEERLTRATSTRDAARVLLEAVLTRCPRAISSALRVCDNLAARDDDVPSLASAVADVSSLARFGTTRSKPSIVDHVLVSLAQKLNNRAILRIHDACITNDDGAGPMKAALRILHDLAISSEFLDRQAWLDAARKLTDSFAVNPSCSGLCCGLLYLSQVLGEDDVAIVVGLRLGTASEPLRAASFLDGFLEVNALVLVKNRPVVAVLDAFLAAIEPERFRDVLPVLRRAFGRLGNTERRYLLENVLATRRIDDEARAVQTVLLEQDKEKLNAISEDLRKAMDELDELL